MSFEEFSMYKDRPQMSLGSVVISLAETKLNLKINLKKKYWNCLIPSKKLK
jgi:hypothetical protein